MNSRQGRYNIVGEKRPKRKKKKQSLHEIKDGIVFCKKPKKNVVDFLIPPSSTIVVRG